ncbi:MAG: hypothetical protein COW73_07040 [Nitrospirae bacterium CG18_big_fil_WC_8_21_14_2_50_70_55]|nr:MAG: hypothetical protein AUK30_01105 [Nitrospirae bacterium CG2_30_70_394]PIQ04888.1 MAG: hypothetical protein COW73_07040 [Nitrospirae bacterium CG18_big_fil_WC_8_21_14_2_50_70_55]PIU78094.1 MAG: hypothetical protein COS73_08100 [Nitrospirae bacterium CG06_land_8_20_14_3_00_70_43]PIW82169.1 MAG: hypothetical protein COZ96_10215 [Nitrospirae bacterium CG_4_8_14_3_um_filter_70_85]PIX82659.1 MAG: hypothetical protein COZ33_09480 [Nitrospirae bacterium CG_4_10_14_3_um_filter_70_108]PJB95137.1
MGARQNEGAGRTKVAAKERADTHERAGWFTVAAAVQPAFGGAIAHPSALTAPSPCTIRAPSRPLFAAPQARPEATAAYRVIT